MNRYWIIENKRDSKPVARISANGINLSKGLKISELTNIGKTHTGELVNLNLSNILDSSNDLIRYIRLGLKADNSII